MLEGKLTGLEKIKSVGTRAISRVAMYGMGVIISLGAMAQEKCEYAASRYAVDGAKAVLAATALYAASCGGEDEVCNDDRDCLDRCIDIAQERSCRYSDYTSAEREQCRDEEIRDCTERYTTGNLKCERKCGERTVSDCGVDDDDFSCTRERKEAYCENVCR